MPGPVSDSYQGPPDDGPYVPSHLYPDGPVMCICGHHEGYHDENGKCLMEHECKCSGMPIERMTDRILLEVERGQ